MRHPFNIAAVIIMLASLAAPVRADDVGEKGRAVFDKNRLAVVTVEVVQKVSASSSRNGEAREAKQDLTGTVVDPSGLTVLALSSVDPTEMFRRLNDDYKQEIEISEVKILLPDGTEIPSEIVLRDKDLDLAFIRPKVKPATPMPAVDFSKPATAQLLDEVIALNRLKRGAGRAFSASIERVAAVVSKPRTFYIPDSTQTETGMGSPAFALDGSVIGIFVMRAVNAQGAGNWRDCITPIILPASDVMKAAAQAPEAKGDDAAPAAPAAPAPASAATNSPPK